MSLDLSPLGFRKTPFTRVNRPTASCARSCLWAAAPAATRFMRDRIDQRRCTARIEAAKQRA